MSRAHPEIGERSGNIRGIYLNRTDHRGPARMDAVVEGFDLGNLSR